MYFNHISELLTTDAQEVLREDVIWPESFVAAAQVVDQQLNEKKLIKYGRPCLLIISGIVGGVDYCLPSKHKMTNAAATKMILLLHTQDAQSAHQLANRLRINVNDIRDETTESLPGKSTNWHILIDTILDVIPAQLRDVGLGVYDQWLVIKAMCDSFFISSTRAHLYIPQCAGVHNVIRDKMMVKEFDGTNVRQLAIKYRVSVQRAYQLIKREQKRQKETRDREMKPL